MRNNVDLVSLEIFCLVAEELSITRAARILERAPSNITTRVQQLEQSLNVDLFLRHNKRLQLSREGEHFLGYARRILALAEEAQQMLQPNTPSGSLRIGSMESSAATRLPPVLALYHQYWPRVRLEVTTGPSRQLLESVQQHRIDCALAALVPPCGDEPEEELDAAGLTGQPMFREELMLVLPSGHGEVRSARDLAVRSLAAFRWGCTYRSIAENWFRDTGKGSLPEIQEVGSYHAMLACVATGHCFSVIPASLLALTPEYPGINPQPLCSCDTWLVWRQGYATPTLSSFRELLAAGTPGALKADDCRSQ